MNSERLELDLPMHTDHTMRAQEERSEEAASE